MTDLEKTGGTMNCGVVSELLESFHAGQLNAQAQKSVQEHLDGCAACSVRLASLQRKSQASGEKSTQTVTAGAFSRRADHQAGAKEHWLRGAPTLALLAIGLAAVVVPASIWLMSARSPMERHQAIQANDPPPPHRELGRSVTTAKEEALRAASEAVRTARAEIVREAQRVRSDASVVARLVRVGDDEDLSERFSLDSDSRIRVYALGEGTLGELHDYAWIEDAATGRPVWRMTYQRTENAGGAEKNRVVDEMIELPAGEYVLRYRSDDSHSFEDWNQAAPPDEENYGVTLFLEGR